jgi:sugar phosphate isomerase/epimerase
MNKITRRTFTQTVTLAGLSTLVPASLLVGRKRHIGVQLWSVREDMKKDPEGTLKAIRKMGYREIEGFGYAKGKFWEKTPKEFRRLLSDTGLSMPSAHVALTTQHLDAKGALTDEWKQAADNAALVGQQFVVSPWMNDEERQGDKLKQLLEAMNKAGEYCKQLGMRFGYHNHDFEFKKSGDKLLYQHILDGTDSNLVALQLDLYWCVFAGYDPIEWLKKHPGRFCSFHVKDMAKTEKRETVEVGEGSINFQQIFAHAPAAGVTHFIVELEDYKRPPMEGIAVAYKNLKKLKF